MTSLESLRSTDTIGAGRTDDTAAIQAAIDAAIVDIGPAEATTRPCRRPVYLPSGTYRITRPLTVRSVIGFRMYGDGASTVIMPDGAMDCVLDLDGLAFSEIDHLRIDGGGTAVVNDVVSLEWVPTIAARSSSVCRFTHLDIMNFRSFQCGFNIGRESLGLQLDCSIFEHCSVSGGWQPGNVDTFQEGFSFGSGEHGNNLSHCLTHPIVAGCRYSIVGKGVIPVTILGGSFGQAEANFLWQAAGPLTCIGGRSEGSQRLYVDEMVTDWDAIVLFQNFAFTATLLHPDGAVVKWNTGGRLKLDGVSFYAPTEGHPPTIEVGAYSAAVIDLDGVLASTRPAAMVRIVGGVPSNVAVCCTGYRQTGADGKAKLSAIDPAPPPADMHVAGDLVVGGTIRGPAIDLGEGREWTADGLRPGGFVKWPGSGGLGPGPDESLRYVGWSVDTNGNRRQRDVVPPLKTKGK